MTLPFLLSIPHGGDRVPKEAESLNALTDAQIFSDGDACTREIYGLGDQVIAVQQAEIARAFVDLNRGPDVRPPGEPDGVVKSLTADRIPVWQGDGPPSEELAEALIERYWRPYHEHLEELASSPDVRLGIDCHSMAEFAPAIAPKPGDPRPLFCLSNGDNETAPATLLVQLADALSASFECDRNAIKINDPFQGGYITRFHGRRYRDGGLPWIQVEMNRCWYLGDPWFDRAGLAVDPQRILELRRKFLSALENLAHLFG